VGPRRLALALLVFLVILFDVVVLLLLVLIVVVLLLLLLLLLVGLICAWEVAAACSHQRTSAARKRLCWRHMHAWSLHEPRPAHIRVDPSDVRMRARSAMVRAQTKWTKEMRDERR
jgi:hypothetical protein